ncbi:RDD family protein [bacterium]|nr:RDD family protein [bacterium]
MENSEKKQLASRWKRFCGAMIDSIIALALTVPIMIAFGVFERGMRGESLTLGEQVGFLVWGYAVFLILHGYLLATRGQTIGKLLVKTRIVDMDGNRVPFGKLVVLRYFLIGLIAYIPCVGGLFGIANVLWIFSEDRRCLHDHIAGTKVVEA